MGIWNNGGFFSSVRGHVIKWWQFVMMPVLRINNNGRKTQYNQPEQVVTPLPATENGAMSKPTVASLAETPMEQPVQQPKPSKKVEQSVQTVQQERTTQSKNIVQVENHPTQSGESVTEDPMEVLRRINEEKEATRRKGIEDAKKKASEEARIAAIMNANKVDVNAFIEAGKAAKQEIAARKADEQSRREIAEQKAREVQATTSVQATVEAELERQYKMEAELEKKRKQDDLRKAQEIMDRLNREAAEDEAKKQAEIEAAKQEAKKQFG